MKTTMTWARSTLTLLVLLAGAAGAGVAPEEAAKLGKELTPLGAIRAGNADGSIPAWEGGITTPPAAYRPGTHHVDPFAADTVLFTITAANADQYKEFLSPGQIAMLQRYAKTWSMPVYPTRRSASYPQRVYDAIIANAQTAETVEGGDGVAKATISSPFPIPRTGVEAIGTICFAIAARPRVMSSPRPCPRPAATTPWSSSNSGLCFRTPCREQPSRVSVTGRSISSKRFLRRRVWPAASYLSTKR